MERMRLATASFLLTLMFTACVSPQEKQIITESRRQIDDGEIKAARDRLLSAVEKYPKNKDILYLAGWTEFKSGNLPGAMNLFARTLQLAPRYYGGYQGYGIIHLAQGHPDQAEKELRQAIDKNPALPELYAALAQAYDLQGNLSGAEGALQKACDLEKSGGDSFILLADFYVKHERYPDAAKTLAALGSRPIRRKALRVQRDCLQGVVDLRMGGPQKKPAANNLLQRCKAADPENFRFQTDVDLGT